MFSDLYVGNTSLTIYWWYIEIDIYMDEIALVKATARVGLRSLPSEASMPRLIRRLAKDIYLGEIYCYSYDTLQVLGQHHHSGVITRSLTVT